MEFHLDNPFQFSGECSEKIIVASLFAAEDLHVAAVSTPHALALRRDTVSLIRQLTETPGGVDRYVAYLAINYLDRFISKHEIVSFLPWSPAFLSATCLSIAAKMLNLRFSVAQFQAMRQIDFDPANVDRMEFVLVEALDWRLRSITAFAFLGYFIRFIQSYPVEFLRDLRDRASRKLIRAQYEMKPVGFKSSVMAAAALLSATVEVSPATFAVFESALRSCKFLNRMKMRVCFEMMKCVKLEGCDLASPSLATSVQGSYTPVPVQEIRGENKETVGCSSDGNDS